jgi:glucosamine-6-phosphate deaminase
MIQPVTANAFAAAAADVVAAQLRDKGRSVLALPTGHTPLGMYTELVRRSKAGTLSLAEARIFNLDEFCGLPPADPHSYAAFMHEYLITPLALAPDHVHLLRGDAADLEGECRRYDAAIAQCGGIDLCVLGLGANGHIAFNEPGCSWDNHTHVVQLAPATRAVRPTEPDWRVPESGITLGIRNLLEARHILLLISGANKRAARDALYHGTADLDWPVTSLLQHPHVTTIELCAPPR